MSLRITASIAGSKGQTRSHKPNHNGLVVAFFLLMTTSIFLFAAMPRAVGDKMVVFVSPWSQATEAVEVIAAADGAVVGMGNSDWIAIGISPKPGFVARLYRSGALFVGSGEAFSACLPAGLL